MNIVALPDPTQSKELLSTLHTYGLVNDRLHFGIWRSMGKHFLANLYATKLAYAHPLIRTTLFFILFGCSYIYNLIAYSIIRIGKINMTARTRFQTLVARDYLFEILKQAEEEGRSVIYIDREVQSAKVVEELITRLFPVLNFESYIHEARSLTIPKTQNQDFFTLYPHLWETKQFLSQQPRDIILIALRDNLAAELEFIQKIKKDSAVHFSTLLFADITTLQETQQKKLPLSQQIKTLTLENYIHALDVQGSQIFYIQLTIYHANHFIVDESCDLPLFRTTTLQGLEQQVLVAVQSIVESADNLHVKGSIKQTRKGRILPQMDAFQTRSYKYVRDIIVKIQFDYVGDLALKSGYKLRECETH